MIIKKKSEFDPILMDDNGIKRVNFFPMLTAKDGTPTFAMRLFEIGPGGHTPRHSHDWEHEVYIISGDGFVFKDGKEESIEKDDFIYVGPSELHQFRAGDNGMSMICVVPNRGQS
ncbi:MAG: cupin domain-containing protein [Actinomycetota bacterium]|nr:cupin domain-containing protein [Actinomycetota bacterium]